MVRNIHKKRQETFRFLNSTHGLIPVEKHLYSAIWILLPYLSIIAILILMSIQLYMGNRRRYRLNKNLTKYLSTVHDVQKDLVQLNQTLNEVSSNREMDENLNDKIRLSIWQINSMQVTLNTLVGLEKEAKWSKNRHSTSLSSDPLVPTVQLPKKSSSLMGKTDYPSINNQEFLEKVFIIIRENYVDPHFNVDTLSYKMGMSRSSFFNKIKAMSQGAAYNEAIHHKRDCL